MTLPNFIAIGPGKTGTTWLYKCLGEHPQIALARDTKETDFFNVYYDRGIGWYEEFFRGRDNARALGEISNTYFFSKEAPARMARHVPQVKLITFLRNPLDRLMSLYLFRRRDGVIHCSFEQAIADDPSLVEQNYFDEHLARYMQFFPRERMFIALYDDLKSDPRGLLCQIYAFLGVDPDFVAPSVYERVLVASEPRAAGLFHALKRFAVWLRENDLHGILNWAKSNRIVMNILTRPLPPEATPMLSVQMRRQLVDFYRPHLVKAGAMIGRDLSGWM